MWGWLIGAIILFVVASKNKATPSGVSSVVSVGGTPKLGQSGSLNSAGKSDPIIISPGFFPSNNSPGGATMPPPNSSGGMYAPDNPTGDPNQFQFSDGGDGGGQNYDDGTGNYAGTGL